MAGDEPFRGFSQFLMPDHRGRFDVFPPDGSQRIGWKRKGRQLSIPTVPLLLQWNFLL
jgi:hypothetical protein